jgi:hypothetical protein
MRPSKRKEHNISRESSSMTGGKNCEGHGWGRSADTFRWVDGSKCIKVNKKSQIDGRE